MPTEHCRRDLAIYGQRIAELNVDDRRKWVHRDLFKQNGQIQYIFQNFPEMGPDIIFQGCKVD